MTGIKQVDKSAGPAYRARVLAQGLVGAPQVSCDGQTVVWHQEVDGNRDIYRYRDGQVDRLSRDPRQDSRPRVNADGSVITWNRFSSAESDDPDGNFDVLLWRAGQESPVAQTRANEMDPTISPDGRSVSWTSDVDGGATLSVVQAYENGEVMNLTEPSQKNDRPVYAGNQHLIWRQWGAEGSDLVMMDYQGKLTQLTKMPGDEVSHCASQDAQTLYFLRADAARNLKVCRLDVPGGELAVLSEAQPGNQDGPVCSADGKLIAWTGVEPGSGAQLFLQEDGVIRPLATGEGVQGSAAMSAAGDRLVYQRVDPYDANQSQIVLLERVEMAAIALKRDPED